ncbi:SH3 domain-containing protein [Methylobacterium sp. WL103]|uniref:SH3 domain-containing protein n=1 Tax=unclassified Methylobacterium TaxID=2615210 RepID=UPI0011C6EC53|nr:MULTISPECIES: SH3 domain-containing protein [unclassified Methylobacterium]TXM74115.1 SH3 domain-containing protein [Methylobacterium sp. WL12]TXM99019.1 SH3 domain-containing protein [Methylobacterium sp. WL103]
MRASRLVPAALAGLLLSFSTGAVRADPVPYRVDGLPRGETLSIRAEPDPSAEVVGEIRARALVAGCTNDTPSRTTWCRVKVGRTVGWARRRYLAPE